MLVHCHMGASRSTATALIALAVLHGPGNEARAFADLLTITNKPWPNYNIVAMADDLLDNQSGTTETIRERILALHETYLAFASQQAHQL